MFEKIISGESALITPEIQKITFKSGQKYRKHQARNTNTLFLITDGEGSLSSGEYRSSFSVGDIFFLPSGCECEYSFEQKGSPAAYAINFKLIGKEHVDKANESFLHIGADNKNTNKIIRMIIQQMIEKSEKNVLGKELLLISYLYKIIFELYSAKNENPNARSEIQRGIKYIEANYLEEFEIEEIARRCGMCLSLFYKSFKENTGLTPIEYKNRLKIDRAIELLKEKRHSLEDISNALNFCNQSYFIRTFKHFTGFTPKQFMSRK